MAAGRRPGLSHDGVPGGTVYLVWLFVALGAGAALPWRLWAQAAAFILALVAVLILLPAAMDPAPDAVLRVGVALAGLAILPTRVLGAGIGAGAAALLLLVPLLAVAAGAHRVRKVLWMAPAWTLLMLMCVAWEPSLWPGALVGPAALLAAHAVPGRARPARPPPA